MTDTQASATHQAATAAASPIKQQRDRYVAFAFAGADLFLEADARGVIQYATGAAKGFTGVSAGKLQGSRLSSYFDSQEQHLIQNLHAKTEPGQRKGPMLMRMSKEMPLEKCVVNVLRLPEQPDTLFITLARPAALNFRQETAGRAELLDKEGFALAAQSALKAASSAGQETDMTLIDLQNSEAFKEKIGENTWQDLVGKMTAFLQDKAVDGAAAGEIAPGRYGVVHDKTIDGDDLRSQIVSLSAEADPEGEGLEVDNTTLEADMGALSEEEAGKALLYTLNTFAGKGTQLNLKSLTESFDRHVEENARKIAMFKAMVTNLRFKMHFQPIVDLNSGQASHYEMLARFDDGTSPYEWVAFGEDIGMAAEFDLAVVNRALNYLRYKPPAGQAGFAINLSGQSIQDADFIEKLRQLLSTFSRQAERVLFEITESNAIDDLSLANAHIQALRKDGFKICLDDFGAGSASFQYLHQLEVDYVKIDGAYIRNLPQAPRNQSLIGNFVPMCRDLGVKTVAEMVEDEETAAILRDIGVDYAQGFYFAKPRSRPDYKSESAGQD